MKIPYQTLNRPPLLVGPASRAVTGMRAEPFIAWVAVTALVVTAEESMLRGAILSALDRPAAPSSPSSAPARPSR